ncbi:MAG: RNA methyltransferase [Acidobacteriota bacterium]
MPRIESPTNPRIAAAVRAVAEGDRMLLEGRRMVEEALDAGVALDEVFVEAGTDEREEEDFLRRVRGEGADGAGGAAPGAPVTFVSPRVLRRLSDLPSTRGIAALAPPPHRSLAALSSSSPSKKSSSSSPSSSLYLLLDGIQDPANVGAIVRCAEAFGVAGIVLTPGSAWPFSPRAPRASAGSALRVPIVPRVAPSDAIAWARAYGGASLAGAEAHGGEPPASAAKVRPLVLVLGSEGHGISPEVEVALDRRLTLPLGGGVESLNAAVAAGLLLFVLTRS